MNLKNENTPPFYRGFALTSETPEQVRAYRQMVDEHYVNLTCVRTEMIRKDLAKKSLIVAVLAAQAASDQFKHTLAQSSPKRTNRSEPGGSLGLTARTLGSMNSITFMQGIIRNQPTYSSPQAAHLKP